MAQCGASNREQSTRTKQKRPRLEWLRALDELRSGVVDKRRALNEDHLRAIQLVQLRVERPRVDEVHEVLGR